MKESRKQPQKQVSFNKLKDGERFQYDGDLFIKTSPMLAWEIRNGRRCKEWAFQDDEQVIHIPV